MIGRNISCLFNLKYLNKDDLNVLMINILRFEKNQKENWILELIEK